MRLFLLSKFLQSFPAFRHRNYRLYFTGQFISLIGTWMQFVALSWLVLELTRSAFLVGLVASLGTVPYLVFALIGGVVVDRFYKKHVLIATQSLSMLLALILGIMTISGSVTVVVIAILSFLLGLVNAIDTPARQSFVVEMVGKEDLPSAIALNSGVFNSARIVGPAISGIVIGFIGVGGAFILNSVSFIAVILALYLITVEKYSNIHISSSIQALKEGISYSFSNKTLRSLLIFIAISSIFGWSYITIMPVVVQDVFKKGAKDLGYFYSASGLGSLLAVYIISSYFKDKYSNHFILSGSLLFSLSIFLFTFTTNLIPALILLFLSGMGIITQFATINSAIQLLVPDSLRGRVMSLYALMFMGMMPFGSFQVGTLSEYFSPQTAIRIGSLIIFVYSIFLFLKVIRPKKT